MTDFIQDIRWLRYSSGQNQGQHPSAFSLMDGRMQMVLQVKIEGEWTDIPVVDEPEVSVP